VLPLKQIWTVARALAGEARSLPGFLVRYPLGIFRETLEAMETPQQEEHDVPVILIHGFFHNRSGFYAMRQHLRKQGFHRLHAFNYSGLSNIETIAQQLADRVEEVLLFTRRERVHIVGHSLGGLVARYYVQALGGDSRVSKCVTMGTPHRGTIAAYLSAIPAATQMRPGSRFLEALNALPAPQHVRWYSFYSRRDILVTPYRNALLPDDRFNVINFNMDDEGHLSFLMSPSVIDAVVEYLRDY
jgi:triacylglycerol lipase